MDFILDNDKNKSNNLNIENPLIDKYWNNIVLKSFIFLQVLRWVFII
jgi:hypothetical protein